MKKWQIRESLIASVLVHCLLLLATVFLPELFEPQTRPQTVEISFLPAPLTTTPTVEVLKKKTKLPEVTQQVVDQSEKPVNDETPEDTKFLSAHNQVVKKQTVAQKIGDFRNRDNEKTSGDGGGAQIKIEDLRPKLDFSKMVERKRDQEREMERTLDENALQVASQNEKQMTQTNRPSDQLGRPGAESSQTSDYLKDVEKGAETLLSTREFVYYSFYARIRRQLNQHWGGKVREKMTKIIKEGRSIASTDDKVTRLMITLNRKGQLVKVQVLNDSGIRDLDDAAVEAFQEAAPFPNPPEGIVEMDGTIKIRWDFILEA